MCDRRFFQIYDKMRKFTTFYNAARLEWRYFWNVWQTYSISPFVDAVVFCTTEATEIDSITVSGEALIDGKAHIANAGSNYPHEITLEVSPIGVNIPLDTSWYTATDSQTSGGLTITKAYADKSRRCNSYIHGNCNRKLKTMAGWAGTEPTQNKI